MRRPLLTLALACLAAMPGCFGGTPAGLKKLPPTTRPTAPVVANGLVVPEGPVVALTGKVKIISDNGGGIISDNGAGLIADAKGTIISDNGGGIISNNTGNILSNNGSGIIANNGGGLTGKTKRRVLAGSGLAVFGLADAGITLEDAAGRVLTDKAGHPITATSGPDGSYKLSSPLPPGNLVAKVKLWNGGTLQAMVARDGAGQLALDLDTASTMGAAYVLGQFVKGSQQVFDKLPRVEAERLTGQLDVVRGYLKGAPKYDAKLLTEATDTLRQREQGVDQEIEAVRALLLGQAAIGSNLPATQVPLGEPVGLAVRPDGTLVIGERFAGRVRLVDPKGVLKTLVDAVFGQIQQNVFGQPDLAAGPDGTIYTCTERLGRVVKLGETDLTPVLGTGQAGRGAIKDPLETPLVPSTLAVGPDGTLYVGESHGALAFEGPPRVYALTPSGALTDLAASAGWALGDLTGLTVEPDGSLVVVHMIPHGLGGTIYRYKDGAWRAIAQNLRTDDTSDLARLPDGHLLVSEPGEGRVMRYDADGSNPTPFLGEGGAPASRALVAPGALGVGPDGTVYVADGATNLVYRYGADGSWAVVAGTTAATQSGDGTAFAINQPMGVAEDDQGRLLIAESGSSSIKRYANGQLELWAGGRRGNAGDGGPAEAARFDAPMGLAYRAGKTWILDGNNRLLRTIGPDGTVATVAGVYNGPSLPAPGQQLPARGVEVNGPLLMALGPDGQPYWASQVDHAIARFTQADGQDVVEGVVGALQKGNDPSIFINGIFSTTPPDPDPAKMLLNLPFGLAFDAAGDLYFSDTTGFRIYKLVGGKVETFAGLGGAKTIEAAQAVGPNGALVDQGATRQEAFVVAPTGICFDAAGTMFVAEAGTRNLAKLSGIFGGSLPVDSSVFPPVDARIRKIATDGSISTIAGPGGKFFTNPNALDALVVPTSIMVDHAGRLVIVDTGANLVRILPAGTF